MIVSILSIQDNHTCIKSQTKVQHTLYSGNVRMVLIINL